MTPLLTFILSKKHIVSIDIIDFYNYMLELGADETITDKEGNDPKKLFQKYVESFESRARTEFLIQEDIEKREREEYERKLYGGDTAFDTLDKLIEEYGYDEDAVKRIFAIRFRYLLINE